MIKEKDSLLEGFLKEEPDYDVSNPFVKEKYDSEPVSSFLKEMNEGKIMTMQEMIDDIDQLIEEREKLKEEVFNDIDSLLMNINNFLTTIGDKIDAVEKLKLQEKLINVQEFKLQEKINAFRDIAALKKERRDRIQEFKEQQHKSSLIDKIVED